jgi:hypothetical protein
MGTLSKEYTLSDGSVWTAPALAFEIGITQTACRYRLEQTNDVEVIMRSKYNKKKLDNKPYKCKQFTLSDGSIASAELISERMNINKSTMYARLLRGERDVAVLAKKPTQGKQKNSKGYTKIAYQPKAVKENIMSRNAYDPLSRLFLMTA